MLASSPAACIAAEPCGPTLLIKLAVLFFSFTCPLPRGRCRDGISHSPLEYVSPDDVAAATATLYRYLRKELLYNRLT